MILLQANSVRSEPTSTLVLTSAARRFVDLRIILGGSPGSDLEYNPSLYDPILGQTSEDLEYLELQLRKATVFSKSIDRLEWGFAGTSSSTPARWTHSDDGSSQYLPAHSKWHRTLDSKSTSSEPAANVVDEGDMWPDPRWRRLELERGHMPHPDTGEVTPYDEIWQDIEASPLPDRAGSADERLCVVLITENEEENDRAIRAQGIIIRVGQFVQGIVKVGDKLRVQRWQWVQDRTDKEDESRRYEQEQPIVDRQRPRKTKHGTWYCTVDLGPKDDALELPVDRTWDEIAGRDAVKVLNEAQGLRNSSSQPKPSWYCIEAEGF